MLTTTYTGSTERKALDDLADLGADVRVSYDTTTTRLHAKAWLFHRRSGHSTAYIGSSNLTHSAQVDGLEWNVRVSAARNAAVVAKVAAVYESYWQSGDFRPYDADEFDRETERADRGPTVLLSPIELRPEPFRERLLEQLAVARRQGHLPTCWTAKVDELRARARSEGRSECGGARLPAGPSGVHKNLQPR